MKTVKCVATNPINSRLAFLLIILAIPSIAFSQGSVVNWTEGPNVADLGENIAQLDFKSKYIFADSADTRKLMQLIGNPVTKMEVGLIAPSAADNEWFMIFEFNPIGYIKDAEKERIDADAILKSIKKATDQANKQRVKKGFPTLNVLGWHTEPHYDVETNNLVWALLADEDGKRIVNYNTRLLGRNGYVSAVLVTDVKTFESLSYDVYEILEGFSFKTGRSYAEYVKGDKLAKLGLAALIVGGTAAAATKFGFLKFLAKGGKFVLMIIFGILSAIWGAMKAFFGRKSEPQTESGTTTMPLSAAQQSLPDLEPNPFFLAKVKQLKETGASKDAFVLLKAKLGRKKIESLEIAKIYYDLLKENRKIPEMLAHAKVYIDLLMDKSQKTAACEIYSDCQAQDAQFAPKPDSFFKIAKSFAQKGDTKQAINACLRLTKTYPEHAVLPEVYFFMAKVLNEKLNNKVKAKKIISWSTKKYPDHKTTPMAQRYLAAIR